MLERLFAHLRWADRRTLAALRGAADAPPQALALYAHILAVEHLWLARLRQVPAEVPVWPALDLDACEALAAATHAALAEHGAALDAAGLERQIPYTNSAGIDFRSTASDILLQVALHGCYHRGQVALLLRQAGTEPEPTDYIAFVRGAPAATHRT